ncbi:response regulator transcription factor [Streptomyces sp. NPDC049881]|uniref:response regulator transcription factor n=1 Tax=Streptomyces sp. NPDC049881 TaxID=3155778 RepID=UPI003428E7C5
MTRVLVIDGGDGRGDALVALMRRETYEVVTVGSGRAGLAAFDRWRPDIVLLDSALPDAPGIDVCRSLLTRAGGAGLIVLSAAADDDETERVVGLELGADDYVGALCSPRELLARVRAVLRRRREYGADREQSSVLEAGPVRVDVERHVVVVAGRRTELPLREFDLLTLLLRNEGRVVTRPQLMDRVWGVDYVGDTKTLDVHVKRLREKIEPVPSQPRYLLTVRGVGYKMVAS